MVFYWLLQRKNKMKMSMREYYNLLEDMQYCKESGDTLEKIHAMCQDDDMNDFERDEYIEYLLNSEDDSYA